MHIKKIVVLLSAVTMLSIGCGAGNFYSMKSISTPVKSLPVRNISLLNFFINKQLYWFYASKRFSMKLGNANSSMTIFNQLFFSKTAMRLKPLRKYDVLIGKKDPNIYKGDSLVPADNLSILKKIEHYKAILKKYAANNQYFMLTEVYFNINQYNDHDYEAILTMDVIIINRNCEIKYNKEFTSRKIIRGRNTELLGPPANEKKLSPKTHNYLRSIYGKLFVAVTLKATTDIKPLLRY